MTASKGFENLYVAIWKQAIRDDMKREPKRLVRDVGEICGGGRDTLRRIKDLCEKYRPELEAAIRQRVYNETLSWPKRADDSEYRAKFRTIKERIIAEIAHEE